MLLRFIMSKQKKNRRPTNTHNSGRGRGNNSSGRFGSLRNRRSSPGRGPVRTINTTPIQEIQERTVLSNNNDVNNNDVNSQDQGVPTSRNNLIVPSEDVSTSPQELHGTNTSDKKSLTWSKPLEAIQEYTPVNVPYWYSAVDNYPWTV